MMMNYTPYTHGMCMYVSGVDCMTLGTLARGDQTMSETMHCDWVWQDTRDGYHYWTCNEHGCTDSEEIEVDLDEE
jgi:hypothetical protein